jgi:hydroxymethylglutaryl-CoA lyase
MPVKIIECPRDAMQGLHEFVPTDKKIHYINQLLKVGFDTIDFGSFVSPKAIPQMQDTAEVLSSLELSETKSKLLAIIANTRGAETAASFAEINYLGFPFSISETFQNRNTNSSIAESLISVNQIQEICLKSGKQLVVYISMGFGNPYGDPWSTEVAEKWVAEMAKLGVKTISLSDTIGIANPESISYLFSNLIPAFPHIEFGAHLHTTPQTWHEKIDAAYTSGCKRFDGALKGYGGCPMATDKLTGNMATENLLAYFNQKNEQTNIQEENFNSSMLIAKQLFSEYH